MGLVRVFRLILVVLLIVQVLSLPVLAAKTTTVVITVVGTTGGISNFVVTYVNDRDMHISWILLGDAVNIMIRAKYGTPPSNIPDKYTTPSDGYLVYYGSGTSVDDTSLDFDQNPGPWYVTAWAQKGDGTWYTNVMSSSKESMQMFFIGLIVLAAVLTGFGFAVHYILLALAASLAWLGLGFWTLLGGNTNLSMSDSWSKVLGFVFIMMVVVPIGYYISQMGKTKITMTSKDGKTFSMWDRPPKGNVKPRAQQVQEDWKKALRSRVR